MARPKAKKKSAGSAKASPARKTAARKPVTKAAAKPAAKKSAPAKVAKKASKTPAKAAKPAKPAKKVAAKKAAPKAAAPVKSSASKAPAKKVARTRAASAGSPAPSLRKTAAPRPSSDGSVPTEAQLRRAPDRQYMDDGQLAFFQQRLLQMRGEVLARELDVKERLHQREVFADPADRASAEEEHWLDLRLRERESLLLRKIDDALRRIRDKEYGYCEKTGEPIGIARLLARPTATVCVDVKGQTERAESQYRDR